ncbi:MAG: nucleotidyltransferase domain-containing protein [Planctomycetes bacterium]|nr:nucleotidyltransferase domain-containing protein [Planctomycetota bacterium]
MNRGAITTDLARGFLPFEWVRFAYLFGSVARGEEGPGSDVDVGISVARPPSADDLLALADSLCRACLRDDVQIVLLDRLGPGILHRVLQEGILLLDRDRDRRIAWTAERLSEWYDFAPTYHLWREAFWDACRRKASG